MRYFFVNGDTWCNMSNICLRVRSCGSMRQRSIHLKKATRKNYEKERSIRGPKYKKLKNIFTCWNV